MPVPEGVRGLLLDIEGTTTPISFVYEVLFPFARRRLAEACEAAAPGSRWAQAVELLRAEHREETRSGDESPPEFGSGAPYAAWLMDRDRKSTGLKALQGLIWEEGYRSGALRGQLFPDVPAALASWRQQGLRLRIFSSGSVLAQRLLFGHSEAGDLTGRFEGFHDTTTGPKSEARSYAAIAAAFGLPAAAVLFLSDVPAELDAAAEAGMATGLTERPGNHPPGEHRHPVYRGFDELT